METKSRFWLLVLVAGLLLGALFVNACAGPAAPAAPSPTTAAVVAPIAVPPKATQPPAAVKPVVDTAVIQKAWESGPHNNQYDLYKGPNTYCASCHSPGNWDPKATVGKPPNCWSCKFPTDKEVRISPNAPLIKEADWKKIGCYVCHQVKDGVVDPKIAIWNNGTGKYDTVTSTTDLCEKCHTDSLGGSMHKIDLGGGAHSNQIGQVVQRPEACTDCHDPHSMKADCKSCHAKAFPAEKPIVGHDAAHAKIMCVACHDATGKSVDLIPGTKTFSTGTFSVSKSGGPPSFTPAYSHEFKKAVANAECLRCHYANNPFSLRSLVTPTPVPTKPSASPAGTPVAKPNPSPTK